MIVIKHYTLSLCWLAPQQEVEIGGDCIFSTPSSAGSRSLWEGCYVRSKPRSAGPQSEISFARAASPAQEQVR